MAVCHRIIAGGRKCYEGSLELRGKGVRLGRSGGRRAHLRSDRHRRGHRGRLPGLQPAQARLHRIDPGAGPGREYRLGRLRLLGRRLPQPLDHRHQPAALQPQHPDPGPVQGGDGRGHRLPADRLPVHLLRGGLEADAQGGRGLAGQRGELRPADPRRGGGPDPRAALQPRRGGPGGARVPRAGGHQGRRVRPRLRQLRPQPGGGGLLRAGHERFLGPAGAEAEHRCGTVSATARQA